MSLTIETIRATEDNEALFDLLCAELQRLLPGPANTRKYPERCVTTETQS